MMEKRRQQAFSAWAGKRGGPRAQVADIRQSKTRLHFCEQAFSSWAGKRAPFSSWAGKRSGEEPVYHDMPEYVR
jgi:hypothetical protein